MPKRGAFKGGRNWNQGNRYSENKYDGGYLFWQRKLRVVFSHFVCVSFFLSILHWLSSHAQKQVSQLVQFFDLSLCFQMRISMFSEHDDRDRKPSGQDLTIRSGSNRRVSFKTTGQGRPNNVKLRAAEMGIRARLEDDDDMAEVIQSSKMKKTTFRRRGSPIPKSIHARTKGLVENASGWFQVLVNIAIRSIYSRAQSKLTHSI